MRAGAALRVLVRGLALSLFGAGLAAASCAYAPDFGNGTLVCGGLGQCPKGYECASDNTCWKTGSTATDPRLADFVGTWDFSSGVLAGSCSDGFVVNTGLDSTDILTITGGGSTGLLLQYYCDAGWNLRLPAGTTTAAVRAGDSCRQTTTDSGVTTTLVWSIQSMMFSTTNGLVGTMSGHITGPFTDSANGSGTCELTFSGNLFKE